MRGILPALVSYTDSTNQYLAGLKGCCYKGNLSDFVSFPLFNLCSHSLFLNQKNNISYDWGNLYIYTFVVSNRINTSLYGCRKCICINTILLSQLDLWGFFLLLDSRWSQDIQMLGCRRGAEHMLLYINCPVKRRYLWMKNCLFHKLSSPIFPNPPKSQQNPASFKFMF